LICYTINSDGDIVKKVDMNFYFKEEFIKRYKYLYENSEYILAPFMHEESIREGADKENGVKCANKPLIYLKIDRKTLLSLEEFLFGIEKMEESTFYKKIDYLKNSIQHQANVDYGLCLLEKRNRGSLSCLKMNLSLWKLLSEVRLFILNQVGDLKNKRLKLEVLDEYFRVNRYSNDGKVWTSGFYLALHDFMNYNHISWGYNDNDIKLDRDVNDIGVLNNRFINFFSNTSIFKNKNNAFHFSEKEKQEIYLFFHDELPWDLKTICVGEKLNPDTSLEMGCSIPNTPYACGSIFNINESDIFIDIKNGEGKEKVDFYQLCPECGYAVKISNRIFNDKIKKRIIDRHIEGVKQLKK